MTEEQLQESVVHLMNSYGRSDVCWAAIPNGEQRRRSTGAKLKRAGVKAGAPDMFFLIDGCMHGVELKTLVGKLAPNQRAFGSWMNVAGGYYHVCYGWSQAVNCLKAIAALKNHATVNPPYPVLESSRVKKLSRSPRK